MDAAVAEDALAGKYPSSPGELHDYEPSPTDPDQPEPYVFPPPDDPYDYPASPHN